MKIYIDTQYPPGLFKALEELHKMQFPQQYELMTGTWQSANSALDTIVFLVDTNRRGLNPLTLNHYAEGYRVFAFKKPLGEPIDLFKWSLLLLTQWKKVLDVIAKESTPYVYTYSINSHGIKKATI
jgi:hypothetical protein